MTESEIALQIKVGECVEKQNENRQKMLLDFLDIHFARIEQMINNAHYHPAKFDTFLLLDKCDENTVALSDEEKNLDAKLRLKAQKEINRIQREQVSKLFSKTNGS